MTGATAARLIAAFLGLTCAMQSCDAAKLKFGIRAPNVCAGREYAPAAMQEPGIPNVGLNPQCRLQSRSSMENVQGTITTSYDVFCIDWKFYGGQVIVVTNSSGDVVMPGGVDIQPPALQTFVPTLNSAGSVSESDAFAAVAAVHAISPNNFALYATDKQIRGIWYDDGAKVVAAYYLVFNYQVPCAGLFIQPTAIVDQATGEVKNHWDGLNGFATPQRIWGVGGNPYYGTYWQHVLAYVENSSFCFINPTEYYQINDYRGKYTAVMEPFCGNVLDIQNYSASVQKVNEALYYAPLVDAAFIAELVTKMFRSLTGFGFNGRGNTTVNININVGSLDYAATDTVANRIIIGGGYTEFYPLGTCTDVVAHEMTHIHVAAYSKLANSGQAGAINEAYCDMGALAAGVYEFNWTDYMFATTCLKPSTNKVAKRFMCHPEGDGGILNVNDYVPGMDIYKAGGVFRKAFCLVAICTTANIGVLPAFKVFAKANMNYWIANSTFVHAACGVRRAAVSIYTQPAEIACFDNAFLAVGIAIPTTCV